MNMLNKKRCLLQVLGLCLLSVCFLSFLPDVQAQGASAAKKPRIPEEALEPPYNAKDVQSRIDKLTIWITAPYSDNMEDFSVYLKDNGKEDKSAKRKIQKKEEKLAKIEKDDVTKEAAKKKTA